MVNFNPLSLIVDATNRPSFYGGYYDVPPLTLGLSSYFGFSPFPSLSIGWHVPTLWGWGSPLSHFGEEWYYPDLIGAGLSLRGYGNIYDSNPERFPYVWNNLLWRNYFPYGMPFPWIPPPVPNNPWPVPQNYGGQAPISAPSSHVEMNGRGAEPPPPTDRETSHIDEGRGEPPPSGNAFGNGTPPPPSSGRSGRRSATHRASGSGGTSGAGGAPPGPASPNAPTVSAVPLGSPLTASHVEPFKRRLGGDIYQMTIDGKVAWIFVKAWKAYLMTEVNVRDHTAKLAEIGSVRDGKLYPNQQ